MAQQLPKANVSQTGIHTGFVWDHFLKKKKIID